MLTPWVHRSALFLLGALVFPPLLLGPPAARAQPSRTETLGLLHEADLKKAAGQYLEADKLYRMALAGADDLTRPRCLDGLLTINVLLARHDQAIQYALSYQPILRQANDLVRWREVALHLGNSYLALGHYRQGEKHLEEALALPGQNVLPAVASVAALSQLAHIAEKRGDPKKASRFWRQVEGQTLAQLDRSDARLDPKQKIQLVWKLADAYRFQQQPDKAIPWLNALLPVHEQINDPAGERATMRLLGAHHNARKEYGEAKACLERALTLDDKVAEEDRIGKADLWNELAETYSRQGAQADADRCRDRAAEFYNAALREDRRTLARATTAFWKLQQLYQKREQFLPALRLIDEQAGRWHGDVWMGAKLKGEKGGLQLLLGAYEKAHQALAEAVPVMEKQTPLNLIDFPRALHCLAILELAAGRLKEAEKLGKKGLDLYREYDLPDDLTLAETYNLVGSCQFVSGRSSEAIKQLRKGVACCEKIGLAANLQHSNLLLNIGLVHKAQRGLDEALRCCERARDLAQAVVAADSLELASLDAALADLLATRGGDDYRKAADKAEAVLRVCAKHQVTGGLLVVTARHCQALYQLYRRQYRPAEKAWGELLALQEKEQHPLLIPRTLNWLGHAAEMQGQDALAEKYYRRALARQQENGHSLPKTQFISLWRLANLAERQGRLPEALTLLEQGMALVEAARLQVYGDAQDRATYFADLTPAFDQLVDWSVRAGQLDEAFTRAARVRSQTLLDQIQLYGADPRQALQGPEGKQLLDKETTLRDEICAIRAEAQFLSLDSASREDAKKLDQRMETAQKKYAAVWRDILDACPVYHSLAGTASQGKLLATVREQVLGPKNLLLVYYLGQERSYLMLLGNKGRPTEVFELKVSGGLLNNLASLTLSTSGPDSDRRGTFIRPVPQPAAVGKLGKPGTTVPLTQERARVLIDLYLQHLEDPRFQLNRGTKIVPRVPAQPDKSADIDQLANVFLPPYVRERIKSCAPDHVLVVPDGALHKLPLEALPLELGSKPRFLLDELPPLIYAPSSSVLALLVERSKSIPKGPPSILTVSNPAYPQATSPGKKPSGELVGTLLGLSGQLPLLPATARESACLQQLFDSKQVMALEGSGATEEAVVQVLRAAKPRIVHFAVHGFADDRLGNLFGALAFTPPSSGQDRLDNDGFLSLHEIYTLPLQECELAVLSACETNVGPQPPLEAGVTLAGAFLAAGAHRVVASHWSVNDRSTAELMSAFFGETTAAQRRGEAVNYAQALQKARLKIRNDPKWAAPHYWAPFVLIGPPEAGLAR